MAGTFPRFRLYDSTGLVEIYEFEYVLNWDGGIFQDPETFIEHTSLRGQGSIITEGSLEPWDLVLTFKLLGSDYENLVAQLNALPTTVAFNTKYILKIDLTSGGSTKDLKVKRLQTFQFPITARRKVVTWQDSIVTFRVNCWS